MPDVKEVFDKLIENAANDRGRRTLISINNICKEQSERGSLDFSIATIARIGEDVGIPKAESIRNKTGEVYRILINAWSNVNPRKSITPKATGKNSWVEKNADPTIRYLVHDLVARNRKLISELQIVKSVKTLEIDMRKTTQVGFSSDHVKPNLFDSEQDALTSAISPKFLEGRGWVADARGRVIDNNGKTVFKNGFVSAIEKLTTVKN